MREKYKKPSKAFKLNKEFNFYDETGETYDRLLAMEKRLQMILKEYKDLLKTHNVYQIPPEIKYLKLDLQKDLKENLSNYKRIKWYHRNKAKYREFFKKRIDKATEMLKFIETGLAKAKKKFNDLLKKDPNYFKKRYEYAIKRLQAQMKKVDQLKDRVMKASKIEGEVIIHFYKKVLDDLQKGPRQN